VSAADFFATKKVPVRAMKRGAPAAAAAKPVVAERDVFAEVAERQAALKAVADEAEKEKKRLAEEAVASGLARRKARMSVRATPCTRAIDPTPQLPL
jgi:hypothetical protein